MLSLEEKHEYSVRAAKISDAKDEGDCWHEAKRVLKNLQHSVSALQCVIYHNSAHSLFAYRQWA